MLNTVWYVGRPRMGTMSSTVIVALPALTKLTLAWYSSFSPTLNGTRIGEGSWRGAKPMRLARAIQSRGRIRAVSNHFPCPRELRNCFGYGTQQQDLSLIHISE